jgi:hypothetical protein
MGMKERVRKAMEKGQHGNEGEGRYGNRETVGMGMEKGSAWE